ncbi:MAG: multiheme c-type cytochrome [Candidatus Eremiobacterota bacterium]
MRSLARLTLLTLGVGWLGLLGLTLSFEHRRRVDDPPEFVRHPYRESRSCQPCHQDIYAQWSSSPHGRAFVSVQPRNMAFSEKVQSCLPCHTPEPVLGSPPGAPPLARDWLLQEGVNCVTCHQKGESIAGVREDARGACNPVSTPELLEVELCQSCHNAHGTVDQWRASRFPAEGRDCLSCHMAGGDHSMPGAHDHDSLRRSVELRAFLESQAVKVLVTNARAGHNLPSGRRSRSMELVVRFSPSGREFRERFRNPFRGEGGQNTQIRSGETRSFVYPVTGDAGVEIELIYQFRPSQPDRNGVRLHRSSLKL